MNFLAPFFLLENAGIETDPNVLCRGILDRRGVNIMHYFGKRNMTLSVRGLNVFKFYSC